MTQINHLAHIMPGWNGRESIVAYIIRTRREQRLANAARLERRRLILTIANLALWPAVAYLAIRLVETLG